MAEDYGLFGPDSVTWKVMGEPILIVGGLRALLMQALHPRAMRGVAQNSALMDPNEALGRFQRTTEFVRVRTYGTTAEAERAGRRVRKIHASLTAYDPDTDSTFRLDEPDGLLWVHIGEVDSYLNIARRSGVSLTDAEADQFVDEWRQAASVVGLDPADVPGSVKEMRDYIEDIRPRLYVVDEAKNPLRRSFNSPFPGPAKLVLPPVVFLAFSTLPRWARRLHGWPGNPLADLGATATLRALYRGTRVLPARLRYQPDARRAHRLMAASA